MTRPIRFRQAIHIDGKFVRWYEWGFLNEGEFHGPHNPTDPSFQYIGITDKNGHRIFEGDILEDGDIHALVEWGRQRAGFYSVKSTVRAWADCEIVGNVVENSWLLK